MTDISLLPLLIIVAFSAFTHGFSGFGYGILIMAAMSFFTDHLERPSVFVTVSVLALIAVLIWQARKYMRIDWPAVGLMAIGLAVGIPLGYRVVLAYGAMPQFRILFGVVLIGFALNGMLRPRMQRRIHNGWAPLFGLASGLLSGAFASGGPPLVIYLYTRENDPRRAVGTLQCMFALSAAFRLFVVSAGAVGIGADIWRLAAIATPVLVAFALLGFATARRVSPRAFAFIVYVLLGVSGAMNAVQGIHEMTASATS